MVTAQTPLPARAHGSPQVLDRAFSLLGCFTAEHRDWTTTALARECDLPVPTTHRIMVTLERFGYVSRDPSTRHFRLGPTAASLGRRGVELDELRAAALPPMRALRDATGESTLLSVLADSRERGVSAAVVGSRRGAAQPLLESVGTLNGGAPFKALLAHMAPEEVEATLGRRRERVGPPAVADPDSLRGELAAIRRRGWAFSREELELGSWALAVPVFDSAGVNLCSLAVVGPLDRLVPDHAREALGLLGRAARRVSERLGDAIAIGAAA